MANGFLPPPDDLQAVYDAVDWSTVVHCLEDAHALASKTYYDDGYLDSLMFGTLSATALASRLREAAELGGVGFVPSQVGDRWSYRVGRFELHFHRVSERDLIPITGKAAKEGARVVTDIGPELFPGEGMTVGRHLVVAIVSDPEGGIERVALIELVRIRGRQAWGHVYAPLDVVPGASRDYGDGTESTPPEVPTMPTVTRTKFPQTYDTAPGKTGTQND